MAPMFWARVVEPRHDGAVQATSAGVASAAAGAGILGMPLSDWLAIGGLLLLAVQGVYWVVRIYFKIVRERASMKAGKPPVTTDNATL